MKIFLVKNQSLSEANTEEKYESSLFTTTFLEKASEKQEKNFFTTTFLEKASKKLEADEALAKVSYNYSPQYSSFW